MAANLPYLNSPGTVDTVLKRIKEAAKPPRFTNDFVNAVVQIKGGAGRTIPPFLKKLGLLNTDGTPTPIYDRLRNQATSPSAVAEALRIGYKPLFQVNEYANKLSDADLSGLILQVTGLEKGNRVAQLIQGTFKRLASHATFATDTLADTGKTEDRDREEAPRREQPLDLGGLRLAYTINLNLPATTNPEVFAAIFRSLRENLLDG